MIVPNKAIRLDDTALGHIGAILNEGPNAVDMVALFHRVENAFDGIDQFLLTLDTLFVLGRIDVDFSTRIVTYVD